MATEEVLSLKGLIDEILTDGRFRLKSGIRIIADVSGRMRYGRIRSIVRGRARVIAGEAGIVHSI